MDLPIALQQKNSNVLIELYLLNRINVISCTENVNLSLFYKFLIYFEQKALFLPANINFAYRVPLKFMLIS